MQVAISVSLAFRNTCYSFHSQLVSLLMCRACLGFYNPCVSYPNHYRSLCTVDFVKDLPLYALRTEWKIHILKSLIKLSLSHGYHSQISSIESILDFIG